MAFTASQLLQYETDNQRFTTEEEVEYDFEKTYNDVQTVGINATHPNAEEVTYELDKGIPDTDAVAVMVEGPNINRYGSSSLDGPAVDVTLNTLGTDTNWLDSITTANWGDEGNIVINPYNEGGYFLEDFVNGFANQWPEQP